MNNYKLNQKNCIQIVVLGQIKKKKSCNRILAANQGGQKNRNKKMTAVFFTMFSTSVNGTNTTVENFLI